MFWVYFAISMLWIIAGFIHILPAYKALASGEFDHMTSEDIRYIQKRAWDCLGICLLAIIFLVLAGLTANF